MLLRESSDAANHAAVGVHNVAIVDGVSRERQIAHVPRRVLRPQRERYHLVAARTRDVLMNVSMVGWDQPPLAIKIALRTLLLNFSAVLLQMPPQRGRRLKVRAACKALRLAAGVAQPVYAHVRNVCRKFIGDLFSNPLASRRVCAARRPRRGQRAALSPTTDLLYARSYVG